MLYLHCGLPRTSTSSLQAAIFKHKERLAEAGLIYPDKWQSGLGNPAHYGLEDFLAGPPVAEGARDDLRHLLSTAHGDCDVLLSNEGLSCWLPSPDKRTALLGLLDTAQRVSRARCIWTLRRYDELAESMYLLKLATGLYPNLAPPMEYLNGMKDKAAVFAGMRRVEEALDGDVVYVRYEVAGGHNAELLRTFGMPQELMTIVVQEVESGPRLKPSLSHKQAVAFANPAALSARAGVELDVRKLRAAFRRDGLAFEQDQPCRLLSGSMRKEMHERALAAAREHGIRSYTEFFEDAEVDSSPPTELDLEAIEDEDLERLLAHLRC